MPFFTVSGSRTLFSSEILAEKIKSGKRLIQEAVDGVDRDSLLATPINDLVSFVERQLVLRPIELNEAHAYQSDPVEVFSWIDDYGQRISAKGFQYEIRIPYEGNLILFEYRPSAYVSQPIMGDTTKEELIIRIGCAGEPREVVIDAIKEKISDVKKTLKAQADDICPYNEFVAQRARELIDARKAEILAARSIAASVGIPLIRRDTDPMTYVANVSRNVTPKIERPRQVPGQYIPEPTLDMQEYEHILAVIQDMTLVMERSPSAFERLPEETLRDFYLVTLNSHYRGSATGETFNASGKTDILIRVDNKNIFVAECKFWSGEKSLLSAIDQLLGYLSWRDTKAALLIFNRNKIFSSVLSSIVEALPEHADIKSGPTALNETTFRCVFGNPKDHNREIVLTVLAFDVPKAG
ncbi:hypothetical protein [Pseudorhodoplanes sinuspersici]|uniref:Uncharacterized protein n=1 Tax=Pseudorhodoplanes sinuspersici TaxID=1235591 RepID=A0A1W6ZRS5_9HYPH|nr:hypothetical protein [Pseudorhodoplanes sinuspersici]ARQ00080.1 hypothetical protein CAK95_14045 [Pseudorhodoplanes sinuspersici]RKE71122.1 hypothetical protein DFP91_3379 [Pseudorhodoplanes sinuspersici]